MRGYTHPINMKRFGKKWVNAEEDLWGVGNAIFNMPHISVVPKGNEKHIRRAHPVERTAASIKEWKPK